jgi:hypothetical protein
MVEKKKLSAQKAADLLSNLSDNDQSSTSPASSQEPSYLRGTQSSLMKRYYFNKKCIVLKENVFFLFNFKYLNSIRRNSTESIASSSSSSNLADRSYVLVQLGKGDKFMVMGMRELMWDPEEVKIDGNYMVLLDGVVVNVVVKKIDSYEKCYRQLQHINRVVQPALTKSQAKTPANHSSSVVTHVDHSRELAEMRERLQRLEIQLRIKDEAIRRLTAENRQQQQQIQDMLQTYSKDEILNLLRMSKLFIACFGTENDLRDISVYSVEQQDELSLVHANFPGVLVSTVVLQTVYNDVVVEEKSMTQATRTLIKLLLKNKADWLLGATHIMTTFKYECDAVYTYLNALKKNFCRKVFDNEIRQIASEAKRDEKKKNEKSNNESSQVYDADNSATSSQHDTEVGFSDSIFTTFFNMLDLINLFF